MKLIPYEVKSGIDNMQVDSDLLENAITNQLQEPVFRLYGWDAPCISLGRNQKDDFIDYEYLKSQNINVVRRITGGRALLHDNEITYSYVCPASILKNGQNVTESYIEISQILIEGLKTLGIGLSFGTQKAVQTKFDYCMMISTGADLCYQDKKLIGSAQCRKDGYILQHGSILYDYDKNLLQDIFKDSYNTNSITCIKEINPEITKQNIIDSFVNLCNK